MNSRQYAKIIEAAYKDALNKAGITEYTSICLSADRTEYEVMLRDGSLIIIESGFDYFED